MRKAAYVSSSDIVKADDICSVAYPAKITPVCQLKITCSTRSTGLLITVAPRYRYCSGTTFIVAVEVAHILLAESSGDSSAATF